jgi:hypothetical protein
MSRQCLRTAFVKCGHVRIDRRADGGLGFVRGVFPKYRPNADRQNREHQLKVFPEIPLVLSPEP